MRRPVDWFRRPAPTPKARKVKVHASTSVYDLTSDDVKVSAYMDQVWIQLGPDVTAFVSREAASGPDELVKIGEKIAQHGRRLGGGS